jgi:tetratricopeptide (TPR) repeat protein
MTAKTKAGSHRPGYTLVMAIIALLAVLTSIRATTWGSYELLIRVTADYHPTSTRALINTANIYIHRNEFDRAHKVLDQMEDIYPDKSYSYMLRVHLMCFENKVTSESVEKAAKSIARGEVESYTIQALQDTINMYHLGRCTTINADQLLTLTNAVLGNDRIDNKKKYYIGLHQAKLLIQIRRFSEAIATIRNIMPYASSAPFAYRHEVFYFLAIAEIYSNQFDEAMASINKLKSVNNNSLINIDDKIRQLEQLYTEQSDRLREELINS